MKNNNNKTQITSTSNNVHTNNGAKTPTYTPPPMPKITPHNPPKK